VKGYALLGLALFAACKDATAPQGSLSITVVAQNAPTYSTDSAGTQLIQCDFSLRAQNGRSYSASWMDATFAFYAPNSQTPFFIDTVPAATVRDVWGADSITGHAEQTSSWYAWATLPFIAKVRFAYISNGDPGATEVTISCRPPTPSGPAPTITTLTDVVDTVPQPSDTLRVSYTATSTVGLWASVIEVSGPCTVAVRVAEQLQNSVTRNNVPVPLPAACNLGVPVRVTVTAFDVALQKTSRSLLLPALVDHRAPQVSVLANTAYNPWSTALASFAGYFFTGDDLTLSVNASDNHALHGVYWEVTPGGLRDSMIGSASTLFRQVTVRAQPGWAGPVSVRFYAVDALGHVGDTIASAPGNIQVGPTVGPTPTFTSVPGDVVDVLFDLKRGVIYLLQSNSLKLSVFSPASLSVVSSITLPGYAPGFDLTPSGDSIVTVFRHSQAIGIVDLTLGSPALQLVPLPIDTSIKLLNVRVAATGRALLATQNVALDSGGVKRLYTYDFAAHSLRMRLDAPILGYEASGRLERSGDARVIVANGQAGAFVRYDAAADAFGSPVTARIQDFRPAIDSTGATVAVAGDVYNASLQYQSTVGAGRAGGGAAAISPDGQTHYMALPPTYVDGYYVSPGTVRSRTSDGSLIDRIPAIGIIDLVRLSPDGSTLVVAQNYNGPARVAVINLSELR
jgi:hypothetical protein